MNTKKFSLDEWLAYQFNIHSQSIDLGLERVAVVAQRMGIEDMPCPVITVAGTNGKGSTIAFLQSIYTAAGYQVGTYTSPHMLRYNERICIAGRECSDDILCESFTRIERARAEVPLSYFEFGTLAALDLFMRATALDVVLLEVGLGGRLDAVNIIDPDVAVVTSISLDHTDWLGEDIESIGYEKAGIFRTNVPAIFGNRNLPRSIADHARSLSAPLYVLGQQFDYQCEKSSWSWQSQKQSAKTLPPPGLFGPVQYQNAATALMVVELLESQLKVTSEEQSQGLGKASLTGRYQHVPGAIETLLDIAHNEDSAKQLAHSLSTTFCKGKTHLVLGMLADKDIARVVENLSEVVDYWYLCGLHVDRGALIARLKTDFTAVLPKTKAQTFNDVTAAYAAAETAADSLDRIVVCGSSYTVAAFLTEHGNRIN
ncbi:Dihydrofolate synthase @ Folylpolyglutamate synthase [hydrothermal vent metagenome]|uniref:Dihydrofolate synthase @ Folylpolyglutamate synthase n=1 Tax=hydrothermal vent metagenome TaxID=652676 RepID=A0A3B0YTJ5_9ZZZZ